MQSVELIGREIRQDTGRTSAISNQGRGFAVALLDVSLKALTGVIAVQPLTDLTFSEIHDHSRQQLDHLKVIKIGQMPAGLSEKKIAC